MFTTFILFYVTSEIFNILLCTETIYINNLNIISQNTMPSDIIKEKIFVEYNNKCVFSLFSDFFGKSNSSYVYYPSHFTDNNIIISNKNIITVNYIECESNNISTLDCIFSKQFSILNKTIESYTNYFNKNESLRCDLNAIATEYCYYQQYCITKKAPTIYT